VDQECWWTDLEVLMVSVLSQNMALRRSHQERLL
jgi:hypothetical protein